MNITADDLIGKFKYFKNNSFRYKHQEEMLLTKEEVEAVINNLEAVEKLKNEIKQMVEERLNETVNKIDSLKQEKARQEALQECCTDSLKLFVANTDTRMANIINPPNLKMWGFDRGLY